MALKTNSKKAKENIWKYIETDLDYINEYGDDIKATAGNKEEIATAIYNIFEGEKHHREGFGYTKQELFKEWAQGLALGGLFDYYYYNRDAVEILGDILEETEEERERFTDEEACDMLTYLIYREIEKFRR